MAATAIPTGNQQITVIFSTPGRRPRPVAESASHRGDTRFPRPAAALARQRLPMTVGHLLLMLLYLLFLILTPLFQQY